MKYLCVGYFDPAKMDALPKFEVEAVMGECPSHMETLYRTAKVLTVAGVNAETKYLQRVDGEVIVRSRSTNESPSQIGCVFIVEADDMDEAVRLASLHPTTQVAAGEHLGWYTEVRPIHYFHDGESQVQ